MSAAPVRAPPTIRRVRDRSLRSLFLASPLASYVVGQTLVIDGGLIL
jgi:NAD(P)-dependent dehydrogenase (short-subunit alcohol dehydrogenase family)